MYGIESFLVMKQRELKTKAVTWYLRAADQGFLAHALVVDLLQNEAVHVAVDEVDDETHKPRQTCNHSNKQQVK